MRKAMDQPGLGIGWKDDKRLTDLDFADDIALVAEQLSPCMSTNDGKSCNAQCKAWSTVYTSV